MKIIKVGAIWCPACLITNNSLTKVLKEYPNLELISLDYDFDEEEVAKYNVGTVLPELIFIDGDKEVLRVKGEKSYKELKEVIGRL